MDVVIYIIDVLDDMLRNGPETARLLNTPVLGTITALAVIPEAVRYYHTIHSEINHWSETFQQLRIELNNANKQTDYTTIMVAAPQCKSATTTVACNLAITQAQAGLRTLIIDMNMHNSALENIFGLKKKKGIWQLLQGDLSIDDCISKITIDNLYVMFAGAIFPNNITTSIETERFQKLFNELILKFDRIIIDTVSMSRANDAKYLLAHCDVLLGVIGINHTTRKSYSSMLNQLQSVDGRLSGIIMNQTKVANKHDSYDINSCKTYFFDTGKKLKANAKETKPDQTTIPVNNDFGEHKVATAETIPHPSEQEKNLEQNRSFKTVTHDHSSEILDLINQIELQLNAPESDLYADN